MKTWTLLAALAIGLTFPTTPALAQDRSEVKPGAESTKDAAAEPSASPKTGGDTRPSAVDPAQATKTGANTGDGASYNRSTEKGDSVVPKDSAIHEK